MHRVCLPILWRSAILLLAIHAFTFAMPAAAAQAPTDLPLAELLRLSDDTYVFRSGGYTSLFVTTDEGVIVVDPNGGPNGANPAALKAIISTVTSQPVRFMVYSHFAQDHGPGGDVFSDTAQFVAHRNAAATLAERNQPNMPLATVIVDDAMTLELGGKSVELRWAARGPRDDYLTVQYGRVIMVVDDMRGRSLPFGDFGAVGPRDALAFVERMLADPSWEWYVWGHATDRLAVGTRDHAREYSQYLKDLMAVVQAARAAGLADNSPEMVAAVTAELEPRYGSWGDFSTRIASNLSGVVRFLDQ